MYSTAGLSNAAVLAALYNASKPLGMGFKKFIPGDMTEVQAQAILDSGQTYFDYLQGRVMKIRFVEGGIERTDLYNRDNGIGAAERIIESLRSNVRIWRE